jgi:hypothetical protein
LGKDNREPTTPKESLPVRDQSPITEHDDEVQIVPFGMSTDEALLIFSDNEESYDIEDSPCDDEDKDHDDDDVGGQEDYEDDVDHDEDDESDLRSNNSHPKSVDSVEFSQTLSNTLSSSSTISESLTGGTNGTGCTSGSGTGGSSTFSGDSDRDDSYDSEDGTDVIDDDGDRTFSDGEESSDDEYVEEGVDDEGHQEEPFVGPTRRAETLRKKVANGFFRGRQKQKQIEKEEEGKKKREEEAKKKREEEEKERLRKAEEDAKKLESLQKEVEDLKMAIQSMKKSDEKKKKSPSDNQEEMMEKIGHRNRKKKNGRSWSMMKSHLSSPRNKEQGNFFEDNRDDNVTDRYHMPPSPRVVEDDGGRE